MVVSQSLASHETYRGVAPQPRVILISMFCPDERGLTQAIARNGLSEEQRLEQFR
jgi:hypothetical protein